MGRHFRFLIVFVLASTSIVGASELSDRAAALGQNEWVKINGDSASLNAIFSTHWTDDEHCEWTDSAAWDVQSNTLITIVQDVATAPHEELTYIEADNAWKWRNFDTVVGKANTVGHNYDELCSNPAGNEFFETRWSTDQFFGTWNPVTEVVDWIEITPTTPNKAGGAQACAFAPWLDGGNGGVVVQVAGGVGHLYWASLSDLRNNPDAVAWHDVMWPSPDSNIHMIMTAHLADEYVIFVGGGDSPPSNSTTACYVWDKDAAAIVTCDGLPLGTAVLKQKLIYDPASAQTILWGGDDSNRFWSYDRSSDQWSLISGNTAPSQLTSGGNLQSTCISQVAIPEYGVVAFVRMNNREWCNANPTVCGIWLTKFGESQPAGPACSDGLDNDSDGATDYPADPGCTSASDESELGTNECDDGVDNDGDGAIDVVDAGCSSATGVDETNCGDGQCEGGETTGTCPTDCSTQGAEVIFPDQVVWDRPTPYSIGYKIPLQQRAGVDSDSDEDSTVTVRYRIQGGGSWSDAFPPLLVVDEVSKNEPHNEGRNYSGAIWNLTPATTYEIEYTINDPDGYNEVRLETAATRAEPVANPASPNYPCPDGDTSDTTDNGAADECDTLAEIQTAVSAAVAGSIIKVAEGTYTGGVGNGGVATFTDKNGTASNPIFLRCMNRGNTVLDGGSLDAAVYIDNSTYVTVEDCTLLNGTDIGGEGQGAGYVIGIKGESPNITTTNIVVRRNLLDGSGSNSKGGIWMHNANYYEFDIIDNALLGPVVFPARGTSNVEGIVLQGQGHVVAHNYITGMGDSIGTARHQPETDPHAELPSRHMQFFGNHVDYSEDDCIEMDYSHANLIIHHNKCENWNACLSAQPTFGGPFYFFRNICWSGGPGTDGGKTLKFQQAATTYGDPAGVYVFNNLLTIPIIRYSDGVWDYVELNNLFVGKDDGSQISNTNVHVCGSYGVEQRQQGENFDDAAKGDAALCAYHGTLDYAAFSYDATVDYPPCGSYPDLATFRNNSQLHPETNERCYENAFIANEPIFATVGANEYPDLDTDPTTWYSIPDPRLHSGSNVIDAGVQIPNVTDSFSGTAPDIGPIEFGDSVYAYGTRGWSYGEPPDDTAPTVPGNLSASPVSDSAIELTWSQSEDPESGVSYYIVYRAGVEVGRPVDTFFVNTELDEASTYTYRVSAVNGAGLESGLSDPASATTLADTTPPTVSSVSAPGDPGQVAVVYSEPVEAASATATSNYVIDNGISIASAELGPDLKTVTLSTTPHAQGVVYTITINNVKDRAATPNTIAPDSQATYQYSAQLVISNITAASGLAYEAGDSLNNGVFSYIDRSYTYGSVPIFLLDARFIKTANDDKNSNGSSDFLWFDVNQTVTVYIAHDDRYGTKPVWMSGFQDTGSDVTIDGTLHSLFERIYAGGTIVLGGNADPAEVENNNMYTVIIVGQPSSDPPDPPLDVQVF